MVLAPKRMIMAWVSTAPRVTIWRKSGLALLCRVASPTSTNLIWKACVYYTNSDGYHILNWIAILLQNRIFSKRSPVAQQANNYILQEFLPDISGYDVIVGYRADDSYFSYAKHFLNNTISVNQLSRAMKLGELGEQVVIKSEKAFEQIHFLGYEIADGSIYNSRRMAREDRARKAYLGNHGTDFSVVSNEIYVLDIIREGMKNDDPRLR